MRFATQFTFHLSPWESTVSSNPSPESIVEFWRGAGPQQWFAKSTAFDDIVRERFEATHHRAARLELMDWAGAVDGALALILLLDQFPRNLYRGSGHAFATDSLARSIAAVAVDAGFDQRVDTGLRDFFYLPFEHSEDPADQALSVRLFEASGDEDALQWAIIHRDIIDRFGRFPHRNAALGRATTPEEARFLAEGGFAG